MEDRRKLERFELRFPALVVVESQNGEEVVRDLTTKDVSADGAYLLSSSLLPEGALVRMEFMLAMNSISKSAKENGRARVRVTGRVIRVDDNGIAIRFGNRYKITTAGSGYRANSVL
jgi:hypothetical protein